MNENCDPDWRTIRVVRWRKKEQYCAETRFHPFLTSCGGGSGEINRLAFGFSRGEERRGAKEGGKGGRKEKTPPIFN